jgi:hypothetical protein
MLPAAMPLCLPHAFRFVSCALSYVDVKKRAVAEFMQRIFLDDVN